MEQTENEWSGDELLPPEGDERVGEVVYSLFAEVITDKSNLALHEKWKRNYELRNNKPWRSKPSVDVPLISGNLLHVHITKTVSALTRNNPTFNVSRMGESSEENKELFDDYQRTAAFFWIDQEQQHIYRRSVNNGEMYGATIEKMTFNPDIEFPYGESETILVDPFHFGFYPTKLTDPKDLQKSQAVFYFYPMAVRDIKRNKRWKARASDVKPDKDILQDLGDERRELASGQSSSKGKSIFTTFASTVMHLINFGTKEGDSEGDEALVCECWCKDYSVDEYGNNLYPGNIRTVVITNGGNVVLEDRKNPNVNLETLTLEEASKTYLFDKFPFCMANSIDDTSNAWGRSDFEQLEQIITEFDKCLSQLTLYKDKTARLKAIVPKDSGVTADEFTNYPGVLEPASTALSQGIRYLEPPAPPIDISALLETYKDLFFTIAQTFELEQAHAPGRDVISYKAIAALIEQASTMMVGKIDSYSRLVRERGRMYLSMVQNFYNEDRWITYRDKDGQDVTKKIQGKSLIIPAKLTVVSGSTMPTSQVQRREEAIELAKAGYIDRKALLDALDYEGRNDINERMDLGLLGQLFQKLQALGMPQELTQWMEEVAKIDAKALIPKVQKQELAPFEAVHRGFMMALEEQQGRQTPAPPNPEEIKAISDAKKNEAEVQRIMAEVTKIIADRDLITEKINTEKTDQQVKMAGIGYDNETIKMGRAKLVKEMLNQEHTQDIEKTGALVDAETKLNPRSAPKSEEKGTPPYKEKGLKSNNEEV